MVKKKNRAISVFLCMLLLMQLVPKKVSAHEMEYISQAIEQAFEWKKKDLKLGDQQKLLTTPLLLSAGTTLGDWYVLAAGRAGLDESYEAYEAVITNNIVKRYQTNEKLSELKATEWHRISLAMIASGSDPTNVKGINLIEDGTYNRAKTMPLDAQGLNGYIWALLTLNSLQYPIPVSSAENRKDIIQAILEKQLPNGGFSVDDEEANVDMTAMALQALAPYIHVMNVFERRGQKVTVFQAVEQALSYLEAVQLPTGEFESWDEVNTESLAQVIIALAMLDLSPHEMERFEKQGGSLIELLLTNQQEDGGFIHAKQFNENNPGAKPNESNTMATEQSILALLAFYRQQTGERHLYDMRKDWSQEEVTKLQEIQNITHQWHRETSFEEVKKMLPLIEEIPMNERLYIGNHYLVQYLLQKYGITTPMTQDLESLYAEPTVGVGVVKPLFSSKLSKQNEITKESLAIVDVILKDESTKYYTELLELLALFERAENKEQYVSEYESLQNKRLKIDNLANEISLINEEILTELYPYSAITSEDADKINNLQQRYEQLASFDQQQIIGYEDVMRAAAKLETEKRTMWIYSAVSIALLLLIVYWLYRKRKQRKEG